MALIRFLIGIQQCTTALLAAALLWISVLLPTQAADSLPNPYDAFRLAEMTPDNQLPLLGDRFRIDDHVDQITMVFFRAPQSRPVVLILPDGSKWYSSRHPEHVRWETGPGFDQVRIESPMRGPWQVSGELRPESRLMVLSDLNFHAESLPELVFQGERLGVTGSFTEAGEPIEQRDFHQAIEMEMHLVSTNQQQYENFGINPRQVGSFVDDGRGLDARARDGVFTGEIAFDVPPGEYIPSYHARTPLYQRTFEQAPIMIAALPVTIDVQISAQEGRSHRLHFSIDEQYFDPDDVVIRGDIEFPNGEIQRMDIRTGEGDRLEQRIPNYVFGSFSVRARLYGTSLHDQRELEAQLASYEFLTRPPEPPGPSAEALAAERAAQLEQEMQARILTEQAALQQQRYMLIAIIAVNLLLVGGWIWFLLWRRKKVRLEAARRRKKVKK